MEFPSLRDAPNEFIDYHIGRLLGERLGLTPGQAVQAANAEWFVEGCAFQLVEAFRGERVLTAEMRVAVNFFAELHANRIDELFPSRAIFLHRVSEALHRAWQRQQQFERKNRPLDLGQFRI